MKIRVTYTAFVGEQLHPDPEVAARFTEVALGDCEFGCKVYADPLSEVRVLAHNSAYGCDKRGEPVTVRWDDLFAGELGCF